ncbi:unnamed protein product [Clonostachys rosea f. rosea IK726]|uniref:Uncharacterized protein n=1 Tax=Clonostachys rosea f. rosea IK726 TaxID=1349383 RepID=A0ACA9UU84_BIOOC|nr:unnamed protein product [Clonostachys rosea f. rosea IK726]
MDIFARSFTLLEIRSDGRSLERLPQEILRRIVEHEDLETQDRKAISLTCSTLRSHALPSLFRCITISQLWQDRENFLHICHTPHLAPHVRDIEWQEISWYPGFFSRAAFDSKEEARLVTWLWCWYYNNSSTSTPGLYGRLRAGDQGAQLAFDLDASINRHFWLFTIPDLSSSVYPFIREERRSTGFSLEEINLIRGRAGQFGEGLAGFDSATFNSLREKAIESFRVLSRPMDPDRVVCSGEYELRARHFQTHRPSWDEEDGEKPKANDGLFLFLFPAIERLQRVEIRITRLFWQDEYQYYSCLRPLPSPNVFEHLQKLELSFFFPRKIQFDEHAREPSYPICRPNADGVSNNDYLRIEETITSLLQAATNLTHLVVDSNLHDRFYLPYIRSTQLVSLHLHSSMPVACDELIPVLQRNSKTLRHIGLDSFAFVVGFLHRIREYVPDLRLESCRLMGASQMQDWVRESHVLDYLNRHGSHDDQADGQRENSLDLGKLVFKRIAIFTEDDLMGAPCWEDSEESEDCGMAEECDYELSKGSAADYWWSEEYAGYEIENARMPRYAEALRRLSKAPRKRKGWDLENSQASEVDEGPEAWDMEMDEDCDHRNRERGAVSELDDPKDTEMLDEDDTGKREDLTADREDEARWNEAPAIDAEDGCADDEMEEEQGSDDEEMDVVEDSGSSMNSDCVETDERFIDRDMLGSELVNEDSEEWDSSRSEYRPSSSSESEED